MEKSLDEQLNKLQNYGYNLSPQNKNFLAGLRDPKKGTIFTRKSRLPILKIKDRYDLQQALLQELMDDSGFDAYFPFGQSKGDQIATLKQAEEDSDDIHEVWDKLPREGKAALLEAKKKFISHYEQTVKIASQLEGPSPLKDRSLHDVLKMSLPQVSPAVKDWDKTNALALTLLVHEPIYWPIFSAVNPTCNSTALSRLSEVPITQLKDKWDWHQAFYELSYGKGRMNIDAQDDEEAYKPFPTGQSKQEQLAFLKTSISLHLDFRPELLKQKQGLPDVSQWVEAVRGSLIIAQREGFGKSLAQLCGTPPTFYAVEELWHSVIQTPFDFFNSPPLCHLEAIQQTLAEPENAGKATFQNNLGLFIPDHLTPQQRRIVEHLMKFPNQSFGYGEKDGVNGLDQTLGLAEKTIRNYINDIIRLWGDGCPIKKGKASAGYYP